MRARSVRLHRRQAWTHLATRAIRRRMARGAIAELLIRADQGRSTRTARLQQRLQQPCRTRTNDGEHLRRVSPDGRAIANMCERQRTAPEDMTRKGSQVQVLHGPPISDRDASSGEPSREPCVGHSSRSYSEEQRGEAPMATGKKAASKAAKELRSKKSTKSERSVAGSDLAQVKKKKPKGR
jgi:hypothetical protein